MIKENKKRGVSLVVLLITIAVTLILLTVIVVSVDNVSNNSKLATFASDLSTVEDLTTTYYMQNNSFPIKIDAGKTEEEMSLSQSELLTRVGDENKDGFIEELKLNNDYNTESDDLGEFYVVDLSKLDIDSSKRGTKKDGDEKDVYVVTYPSFNIYYLKGLKVKNNMYFSLSSKLTNKVKIDENMEYSNDNVTTVQSIEGLTVKKLTKGWTNSMGIYVQSNLESDEELYLEATGVAKKKLVTNSGNNEFSFDDLSEVNGFSQEESNTFKNSEQSTKKIIFTKQKASVEVGKIEVDMTNYETTLPQYSIEASNIIYSEEYNMVPFIVADGISGVKEVRYEYLTSYDKKGNIQNHYTDVEEYDVEYLRSKGKKAIPDKDGNITLKIDKYIQGIQLIVIDKAGNILSRNNNDEMLAIGMYNEEDNIYIGLDLKQNTEELLSYDIILVNKYGISNVEIQTSTDAVTYSDAKVISVNSTSSENVKIISDSSENLGKIKFLKVTAFDNLASSNNQKTRIFKLDEENLNGNLEIGKITNKTQTFDLKTEGKYYNPIIPAGFAPVNEGDAVWGSADGWYKGLVIKDENGNEFVWIPVENSDNDYAKDLTFPGLAPTEDDTLPTGITDEAEDVKKHGGFYIGRYEAGIPEGDTETSDKIGVPVSKQGAIVWTDIDYENAKASAESMASNDYVQTGLITGKSWDTTCHWIESEIKKINTESTLTNSVYYGNYSNSAAPANVTGYGEKQSAGFSDKWRTKNIYDLAGNAWEWTNEKCNNDRINRGGDYGEDGKGSSVVYRNIDLRSEIYSDVGFRIRLYIK